MAIGNNLHSSTKLMLRCRCDYNRRDAATATAAVILEMR